MSTPRSNIFFQMCPRTCRGHYTWENYCRRALGSGREKLIAKSKDSRAFGGKMVFPLPYSPWVSINTLRFLAQKSPWDFFFSLSTTYGSTKNIFSFSFHVHYSPNRAHFSRKSSQHSPLHEEGGGGTKSFSLFWEKSQRKKTI